MGAKYSIVISACYQLVGQIMRWQGSEIYPNTMWFHIVTLWLHGIEVLANTASVDYFSQV